MGTTTVSPSLARCGLCSGPPATSLASVLRAPVSVLQLPQPQHASPATTYTPTDTSWRPTGSFGGCAVLSLGPKYSGFYFCLLACLCLCMCLLSDRVWLLVNGVEGFLVGGGRGDGNSSDRLSAIVQLLADRMCASEWPVRVLPLFQRPTSERQRSVQQIRQWVAHSRSRLASYASSETQRRQLRVLRRRGVAAAGADATRHCSLSAGKAVTLLPPLVIARKSARSTRNMYCVLRPPANTAATPPAETSTAWCWGVYCCARELGLAGSLQWLTRATRDKLVTRAQSCWRGYGWLAACTS